MAVGLEHQGESYGLLVDQVGEVMKLARRHPRAEPGPHGPALGPISRGVHRLDDKLLIILDVDAVLALDAEARAA